MLNETSVVLLECAADESYLYVPMIYQMISPCPRQHYCER